MIYYYRIIFLTFLFFIESLKTNIIYNLKINEKIFILKIFLFNLMF